MINLANIPNKLMVGLVSVLTGIMLLVPGAATVNAIDPTTKNEVCEGIAVTGEQCNETSGSTVSGLIASAVNILSWVVGVAAIIMVIVGGFKYVTSGGDTNAISSAKNTILFAIIGLVVAVLAQAIVKFVLQRTT